MSYGLSFVLGVRHGLGNCLVFQHLEEYYPEGVAEFQLMMEKHNITLPTGVCAELSEQELDQVVAIALGMVPLWENALGPDWKSKVSPEDLKRIYRKI